MAALHQHVPRALAFCAVTESPEAVKERITTFLTMPPGKAYCTECLAEEARLPLERVRGSLGWVGTSGAPSPQVWTLFQAHPWHMQEGDERCLDRLRTPPRSFRFPGAFGYSTPSPPSRGPEKDTDHGG